jgi:hypothetical protein
MKGEMKFVTGYRTSGEQVLADFDRFVEYLRATHNVVPVSRVVSRTFFRKRPKRVVAEYGHATLSAMLKYDGRTDVNVMTLALRGGSPIWGGLTVPNSGRLEKVFDGFHFRRE